jgi:hypothetical protein
LSIKKQEFMEKRQKRRAANRVVIGVFVLVALFGVVVFTTLNSSIPTAKRWEGGTYNIGKQVDYSGKRISMTDIDNQVENGKVVFPLASVVESSFIATEYKKDLTRLPLLAFISPAGRLVVGIGYCEPCRSESFHIDGKDLVCDTCRTRWQLNDLRGLSGGCPNYPPEELNYEVIDGMVVISEADILSWVPREFSEMEGL